MRAAGARAPFVVAWRVAARLPEDVVRAVMLVAADVAWAGHGAGVRQLETNLRRVRPDLDRRGLRRLSRAGMRNYLRYFAEVFTLGRLTPEQVQARVRALGTDGVMAEIGAGRSAILAVGHEGNWDLAGAWATQHLAPVTTVAERLEPAAVFEAFVEQRERFGITVIPMDAGSEVFRDLLRAVRGGRRIVPLLADRDLTARGVEVDLFGERARVAAGPAALAATTGARVFPTSIRHERLRGARRRAAGTRWGIVLTFHPPVPVQDPAPRAVQVERITQAWLDTLAADIGVHPAHWHMLQKVFVGDLDPERYAGTRAAATTEQP